MITEKEIEIAEALLATGLIDQVYHSVKLVEDKTGVKFPAYAVGGEEIYVGPDDSKPRICYIRQTGPAKVADTEMEGSCSGMTKLSIPLRIVVFKDFENENHDALVQRLLSFTFLKDVKLATINTNAFQLAKQESPIGDFAFDATTFYVAIDVQARIWVTAKMCAENTCHKHPNPICKP